MKAERLARWALILFLAALPLGLLVARGGWIFAWLHPAPAAIVEIHAAMPEKGGWSPSALTVYAEQAVHLRLTSDDVMHGFAVGQSDHPPVDVIPGEFTETTLTFDQPGQYTFYCTRWCGPNHWRMRGTIEVLPLQGAPTPTIEPGAPPLYVSLGLDIDAPHAAQVAPQSTPSAARGARLDIHLPPAYLSQTFDRTHSPAQVWEALRHDAITQELDDEQVWDLVALIWAKNISPQALETGKSLYAQNCAACHGESGAGDGVFAASQTAGGAGTDLEIGADGHSLNAPADFTDPSNMLGASPALLEGKIVRGGMGTGMPYWGPIFTQDQIWALIDALYAFQFNLEVDQ